MDQGGRSLHYGRDDRFKMYYLLLLLLLLFPFGQLLRIPLGISSVSLYGMDIMALACFLGVLFHARKYKDQIVSSQLFWPLSLFVVFGVVGLLINPLHIPIDQLAISSLYLARFIVYAGLYVCVRIIIKNNPEKQTTILYGLFGAGVLLALFGILQYFLYPNLRNLYYLGWDPHQYRLFSTLFDPNFTGIVLVLTVLLGGSLWGEKKKISGVGRLGYLSILGMVVLALILTYSRSSYVAFILGLVLLYRRSISWKWVIFGIVGFGLVLYLLPRPFGEGVRLERTSTIFSRLKSYESAISIIKQHPLTGVGFNAYRYAQHQFGYLPNSDWEDVHSGSGTDNSLLFVWATAGIGGIAAFLWLLYRLVNVTTKTIAQKDLLVASTVAVLLHSFFVNSFFYTWVLVWIFILVGVVEVSRTILKR